MREKADSELVRRQNRRIVLETLRGQGPQARIGLGRSTGLSPASITSISSQLMEDGIIVERHDAEVLPEPNRRGRPQTLLDLDPAAAQVLAVKISIDGIELALADYRGTILRRGASRLATYDADASAFGGRVADEIAGFLAEAPSARGQLARIAIAIQGVADSRAGTIMWSPAFRARNIAVVEPVQRALGIACSISNDANMIAEGLDQRSRGETSAVVFIGYGVGMGLILDGKVYHGPTGAAAEFGHMNHLPGGALCRCGRRGCVEAYAADYGILRSAGSNDDSAPPQLSAVPVATMRQLEDQARAGEPRAVQAYRKAGEAIGYGLARLAALLNPTRILLSGPGTHAIELIRPHLMQAIEDGVVAELRQNLVVNTVPIDTDMIIKGTIDSALRELDREVFAGGAVGRETFTLQRAAP
jgi:predicted NBD/HSP70 family sugar kinase